MSCGIIQWIGGRTVVRTFNTILMPDAHRRFDDVVDWSDIKG